MPEGVQISPQPSEVGSVSVQNVVRKFIGKTTAPTVNDDITEGYIVSDIWIDETGDKAYQCLDNTDGAAVWEQLAGDGQDHGVLAGLTDDDHTQYVLREAIRHTINAGEDYVIKDFEQRLVYEEFITNGSGSVTIDGSGELVVGLFGIGSDRTARITTTTTLDESHHVVFGNTDGGAYTVTLPAGVGGKNYKLINSGASGNNLTLASNGAEHLIGANTSFILHDGETLNITYNTVDGWY